MKGKLLYTNAQGSEITAWSKDGGEEILAKKFGLALVVQNFLDPRTQVAAPYAFCRKTPGVTVVPVLTNGDVVVTRTFKQGSNAVVWEFPAGRRPKDVAAEDQAKAELSEESGLVAGKMIYLGRACVAPRKFDTYEDLFVAIECTVGTPKPGEDEILEVYQMTPEELWEIIQQNNGSFSGFSELAVRRAGERGYIQVKNAVRIGKK